MNYKAIVLDLDGTLLSSGEVISEVNKEFLKSEKDKGVNIILATGRPIDMAIGYHEQLELETPLICLNGAVTFDRIKNKVIDQEMIMKTEIDEVIEVVTNYYPTIISHTYKANYELLFPSRKNILISWLGEEQGIHPGKYEHVLKMSLQFHSDVSSLLALIELMPNFEIVNWGDSLEIMKKGVNKWSALKNVLETYHLHPQEVIAFGDGPNDVDMLKNVGTGVAMANGRFIAKSVADFITLTNDEDGVANFFPMKKERIALIG